MEGTVYEQFFTGILAVVAATNSASIRLIFIIRFYKHEVLLFSKKCGFSHNNNVIQ